MTQSRAHPSIRWGLMGLVAVIALAGGAAASTFLLPRVNEWLKGPPGKPAEKVEKPPSHELVRKDGKPVYPPALRLSEEAAASLGIGPKQIYLVRKAEQPRPLPPLEGNLAYDTENLFPVRPRFSGELAEFTLVPKTPQELSFELEQRRKGPPSSDSKPPPLDPNRPIGFGDFVKKGDLLAVVWSKDLGEKKAALIDALIDLRRDQDRLVRLRKLYMQGYLSESNYYEALRTVEKEINQVNAAERTLRMWKLSDKEIQEVKDEAGKIAGTKRDPKKEKDWARVEVRAPHDGVVVEKNTNLGDWVDPVNGNPIVRIADLSVLAVWVHPFEEYLPVFQKLLSADAARGTGKVPVLRWKIRLQAEPQAEPLEGPVLKIAPSLDPTQRTLLVMGRVGNPGGRLLVGQFVTATVEVKPPPGLVEIPTSALNEDEGQSLVFVQTGPLEFQVRRVQVAERFRDRVFVRAAPDPRAEVRPRPRPGLSGPWPVEGLRPGERVVTQGVPMLTFALRDLIAREDTSAAEKK
jgi:cobalt-zinc-cadmium efflux system membrane fusion protein